ncbi:MAG: acetate--CoA ligase family protein [Candidatus Moraniibacteriota bacterium]
MNIKTVFEPKSIAIIGASTHVGTVGNDIVKNLVEQGYAGEIFPVNPKATELYGRKCYADISEVPSETVDLAVIVIPAIAVPGAVEEAAKTKHIQAAVVISAGFKEMGNVELEQQLAAVANQYGVALVGPNCLGSLNPYISMNASFAKTMPSKGSIAFVSQSGALCTAILDYAQSLGLGFSRFVSVGNKAILDEEKFLEYFEQDEATKVIAMYVEDLKNPRSFLRLARRITHGANAKPIVVIKSGRTQAGSNAVASHTGSLAGSDTMYDALFAQAGILRVETIDELFGVLQILSMNEFSKGKQVAIITNAGGPGVLATDALVENGLELAKLSEATQTKLHSFLPPAANTHNPVDVLGDALADRYASALEVVSKDAGVDSLLVLLTPQSMTEIEATAEAIVSVKETTKKPIAVSLMGSDLVQPGNDILLRHSIATFRFPEEGADALAMLSRSAEIMAEPEPEAFTFNDINQSEVRAIFDRATSEGKKQLPEAEAVPVFEAYGFRTLRSVIVRSAEEAREQASTFASKVVFKIVSPDILHKSDVGGVRLNIEPKDFVEAYDTLMHVVSERAPEARLEGALIVEMAPGNGVEMVLGCVKDPLFGHMAMIGLGGILVEILKDVSFGMTPLDRATVVRMIDGLKARKILDGVRGGAALDIEALVEAVGRLSQLLTDFPEIKELDINPLLILPKGQGTILLDARVVLE